MNKKDHVQVKGILSRVWYYLEPWMIDPPQRPMLWQGLAIKYGFLLGVLTVLWLIGEGLALLFR